MQQQPDPAQIHNMMMTMIPFMGFFAIVIWAIVLIPFWQIFKKAGMSAPLALLMIVPVVNLVMLYVLAFSQWKVVPAPEFAAGYPPPYPPPGFAPPAYPPAAAAQPPAYVPPPPPTEPPSTI